MRIPECNSPKAVGSFNDSGMTAPLAGAEEGQNSANDQRGGDCSPTLRARSLRDDDKDFRLLASETSHLVRGLAGKIQAVALGHDQLFAVELDRDLSVDDKQHLFAGVR